jgi:hypothetical protein
MHKLTTLLAGLLLATPTYSDDAVPQTEDGQDAIHVSMHKNPGCGCCDLWAEHMRSFGFVVESIEDRHIVNFKNDHGIPGPLMSCHTAVIDGYFVEGHVPAQDILRLLSEKPEHVTGIAVPGMPLGSPGMEHPRPQDFNTIALLTDGTAYVFESHAAGEDFSPGDEE